MITLIGFRWKHSNVLSREVLIVHILLGNLKSTKRARTETLSFVIRRMRWKTKKSRFAAKSACNKRNSSKHIFV